MNLTQKGIRAFANPTTLNRRTLRLKQLQVGFLLGGRAGHWLGYCVTLNRKKVFSLG